MSICEAFSIIVTAGVKEVLFDCERREILIITNFGERYSFKVQEADVE